MSPGCVPAMEYLKGPVLVVIAGKAMSNSEHFSYIALNVRALCLSTDKMFSDPNKANIR